MPHRLWSGWYRIDRPYYVDNRARRFVETHILAKECPQTNEMLKYFDHDHSIERSVVLPDLRIAHTPRDHLETVLPRNRGRLR